MDTEMATPTPRPLDARLLRELIAGASMAGEQGESSDDLDTALRHVRRARRLIKFELRVSDHLCTAHIGCLVTARAELLAAASTLDKALAWAAERGRDADDAPAITIDTDAFLRGTRR